MKVCSRCGESKPLGAFYANKGSSDGHRGDCKSCVLAARATRYASDTEYRERTKNRARSCRPATKPRVCRRCGVAMVGSRLGRPGLCVGCKRSLGYRVQISKSDRLAIYERDGWVCQICSREVDKTLHPNHTFAATLDHVTARSMTLFPDDSPTNLRLAHRSCNSRRGNRAA